MASKLFPHNMGKMDRALRVIVGLVLISLVFVGPKTPWGKPAMGKKTRRNKRTDQFIVRRRGKRR